LLILAPFNITSYEPETLSVEEETNVTLLCEVTVDEDYDMDLVSVFYRYYPTAEAAEPTKYNVEIINASNKTITARLNLKSVGIQHIGIYECYVRSLSSDRFSEPNDDFYEAAMNTTLIVTEPDEGVIVMLMII